jgi:hypothetical protein
MNSYRSEKSLRSIFQKVSPIFLIKLQSLNTTSNQIRVPGSLKSHYAPNAKVFLSGTPKVGDGLIALSEAFKINNSVQKLNLS